MTPAPTIARSFTVDRPALLRAIKAATHIAPRRAAVPVLTGMRVTANGALTLECTDLDRHVRVQLAAEAYRAAPDQETAEITLIGQRQMATALTFATDANVLIDRERDDGKVRIHCGDLALHMGTRQDDEFPTLAPIANTLARATLGATEMQQIARVTAAISTNETRYYLNGIAVHKIGDWLYRFAATDGHRLMMVDVPLPDMQGQIPDGIIITRDWIAAALHYFRKAKDGCTLTYGNAYVRNSADGVELPLKKQGGPRITIEGDVDGANVALTGKLIDGTYPDYMRVVPRDYIRMARINRAALIQAMRSVASFSTEKTRAVKLTFEPGVVRLSLNSIDLGESVCRVSASHNIATGNSIGANGQYLLDILTAFTGEDIELHFADGQPGMEAFAMLFRDPADTAFQAVLMPMRV